MAFHFPDGVLMIEATGTSGRGLVPALYLELHPEQRFWNEHFAVSDRELQRDVQVSA
jgi:hypothetical protein